MMQPRHMQGKRRGPRALTVVLSILAVILAAFCVLSWMLLDDPNAGRTMERPSDTVTEKAVAAAASGEECALTPQEVSGFLNNMLQKKKASGSALSSVSVTAGKSGTTDVYVPVRYAGKTLGVSMNLSPSFDPQSERMLFTVHSMRVGRLPVPKKRALEMMESRLPSILSRDGDVIACDTKALFRVSYRNMSAQLKMKSLRMESGTFRLKFGLGLGFSA